MNNGSRRGPISRESRSARHWDVHRRPSPGKRTEVCTSLTGQTATILAEKARTAFADGTDLVEFRVDSLSTPDFSDIRAELGRFAGRSVFTVRPARIGGGFEGKEARRLNLIRRLSGLHPAFLDIELSAVKLNPVLTLDMPRRSLIISWHDMDGTPGLPRLRSIRSQAVAFGLPKIVTTAKNADDAIPVLSLYDGIGRPPIAFCMGECGIFSRVMAMQCGSPLTYACPEGEPVASGQLTLGQTLTLREMLEVD